MIGRVLVLTCRLAGAFVLALGLAGCAVSWVDAAGATHVLGLTKTTIHPTMPEEEVGSESVEIRTLGLSIYRTPLHGGIAIGYHHETLTAVRRDVRVGSSPRPSRATED